MNQTVYHTVTTIAAIVALIMIYGLSTWLLPWTDDEVNEAWDAWKNLIAWFTEDDHD